MHRAQVRETPVEHSKLLWTHCRKGCAMHQQQFEDARQVDNHYHSTLPANNCEAKDCPIHKSRRPEPRKRTTQQKTPHENIH
jgi:hypothetical protein